MNKEFIPYKQALELKELGFDDKCSSFYYKDLKTIYQKHCNWDVSNDDAYYYNEEVLCSAPLYQQSFRWFREKYGLNYFIKSENNDWEWAAGNYWGYVGKNMATYEEVQLGCLNKLIDIMQIDKSGEWFAKNADIKIEIAKNK